MDVLRNHRIIFLALGVSAVGVIGVTVYFFTIATNIEKDAVSLTPPEERLLILERIFSCIKDAETGQRGFLLTGDETYLAPYTSAVAVMDSLLSYYASLAELDNPRSKLTSGETFSHLFVRLSNLMQVKATELTETLRLRREQGFEAAQKLVVQNKGKHTMDSIRAVSSRLQHLEAAQIAEYRATNRVYIQRTIVAIPLSGSIILLALGWVGVMILRHHQVRVRHETALREQQKFTEAILNTVPGLIVLFNIKERRFEYINSFFVTLSGYAAEELKTFSPDELFQMMHPNDATSHQQHLLEILTEGSDGVIFDREYRIRHKDGSWRWVNDKTAIFRRAPNGTVTHLLLSVSDITRQKVAEEQIIALNTKLASSNAELEILVAERTTALQEANATLHSTILQLQAANAELEAFSYSISHDLRAPLRTIHGFAEMLKENLASVQDEETQRLLGKIHTGAQKMGVLIDELLTFSRLGRKVLDNTTPNMNQLVMSVLAEMNGRNELAAYTIEIGELHNAPCDTSLIRQVWFNLLSNAIKYSRHAETKRINISSFLRPTNDETTQLNDVVYVIQDSGVGFDMRYVDKLFQVFQRLHREREFEGTGVGLAIVKRVVMRHGGNVTAEAALGKGATFSFSLPTATERNANESLPESSSHQNTV